MAALSEQEIIRREKLERLRELGINPYPAPLYPVDQTSASIKNDFVEEKEVIIARINSYTFLSTLKVARNLQPFVLEGFRNKYGTRSKASSV